MDTPGSDPNVTTSGLRLFCRQHILIMLPLGFASGLPLLLSQKTLIAWLADTGTDIRAVGLFSLVALPYSLKFLWAPLMDRYQLGFSQRGHRRAWILASQYFLMVALATLATLSPEAAYGPIAVVAVLIAFLSASQDICFDAYRADLLLPEERGFGAAVSVAGYRIAMIVAGGLALVLSDVWGWQNTYLMMAGLMGVSMIVTWIAPDPVVHRKTPTSLGKAFTEPWSEFIKRPATLWVLLVLLLFKLCDALAGLMAIPFLLDLKFSMTEIGAIYQMVGLLCTIAGGLLGGWILTRMDLITALLIFAILQALTNLGFLLLSVLPQSQGLLATVIGFEQFVSGMSIAAFVTLLIALCHPAHSATQFAIFTALAGLFTIVVGSPAGYLQAALGWPGFFVASTVLGAPVVFVLAISRKALRGHLKHVATIQA